jgi:hypothetical protein
MGFEDLLCVLSCSLLKLDSEDSPFRFVVERISGSVESFYLFEFVHFEHLDPVYIEEFISFSGRYFDRLTIGLWNRLCLSLLALISKSLPRGREFRFGASSPFCGRISYLTQKHGGNPHTTGIISVTMNRQHFSRIVRVILPLWHPVRNDAPFPAN